MVDDRRLYLRMIHNALAKEQNIDLIETAETGSEALNKLKKCSPDILILDVELPDINGIDLLKEIRKRHPSISVLMYSSFIESRQAKPMVKALILGAIDFVPKPSTKEGGLSTEESNQLMIKKIKWVYHSQTKSNFSEFKSDVKSTDKDISKDDIDLVIIGCSTGGPEALKTIIKDLPEKTPPILLVQHMPEKFTTMLAADLSKYCRVPINEVTTPTKLEKNAIWLAGGGFHMVLEKNKETEYLLTNNKGPLVHSCRPAIDVTVESALKHYHYKNILLVILTGMGNDGSLGAKAIYENKGRVMIQDKETSIVWGMPGAIAQENNFTQILPLENIGHEITKKISLFYKG